MVQLSEVVSSFWGTCVEGGKNYTIPVEKNFTMTMAAIDPQESKETEPVTLYLKSGDVEYVLCTLVPGKIYQEKLDLVFEQGEDLDLVVKGKGKIHLTGYYTLGDDYYGSDAGVDSDCDDYDDEEEEFDEDMMDMDEFEDEEEEEEDDDEEEVIVQGKRKKFGQPVQQLKKVKFEEKKPADKNNTQKKSEKKDEKKQNAQKQQQQNNKQKPEIKQNQKQNEKKPQEQKNVPEASAGKKKNKKKKNKKNKNKSD